MNSIRRFRGAPAVLRNQRNQRGYSLIELGIAIAILAVIIVGSLVGVQSILRGNRTNDMLKVVPSYIANATKVTATQTTVAGVTTAQLISFGVFPTAKVVGTSVNNEHGGQVHLFGNAAAIGNYAAGQTFILSLTNIPRESCADVAAGLDTVAYAMNIESSNLNAAGGLAATAAKPPNSNSIDFPAVAAACGAAGAKRITVAVPRA